MYGLKGRLECGCFEAFSTRKKEAYEEGPRV
jgi:hypothetical protein